MSASGVARAALGALLLGALALAGGRGGAAEGAELWIVPALGISALVVAFAVWRADAAKPQRR